MEMAAPHARCTRASVESSQGTGVKQRIVAFTTNICLMCIYIERERETERERDRDIYIYIHVLCVGERERGGEEVS